MPSYPRITRQPNTFPQTQTFTNFIRVTVDGVTYEQRPFERTVGGKVEFGIEMRRVGETEWRPAASRTR